MMKNVFFAMLAIFVPLAICISMVQGQSNPIHGNVNYPYMIVGPVTPGVPSENSVQCFLGTHVFSVKTDTSPVTVIQATPGVSHAIIGSTLTNSSASDAEVIIMNGGVTCFDHTLAANGGGGPIPYPLAAPTPGMPTVLINPTDAANIEFSGSY
ncbi:MAG: hypothetical protein ACRDFB_03250 [Rhabdochlamydiaceae bacterium]